MHFNFKKYDSVSKNAFQFLKIPTFKFQNTLNSNTFQLKKIQFDFKICSI